MIQQRSDSINLIDLPLSTARSRWLVTYPWLELVVQYLNIFKITIFMENYLHFVRMVQKHFARV